MAAVAYPKDRTKREHVAKVDRVVFGDPAQPFVILALTDGLTAVGNADPDRFDTATVYRFLGRWEDDQRRGPRFRFGTYCVHGHHGRAGVVKYLCETVEGIGPTTAGKLWQEYGGSAVEKLRTCPAEVAETIGIDPDHAWAFAVELERAAATERTRIDLFDLFDRRGFQGKLIDACIDKWGARAPGLVRRNPFALLGLPSAGFKRCDKLWTDLGLPPAALKRQAVYAWNELRTDPTGHTWVAAEELAGRLRAAIPGCDPRRAFKLGVRARRLKVRRDAAGKPWLAVYDQATAEERVAAAVARLSAAPCEWPTRAVPVSAADGDGLPSAHQVERLLRATASPVGLLLGGPGTGKSHLCGYLLREVVARYGHSAVAVCAPTGKAAVRMTQAIRAAGLDVRATTIHRTLAIGRNGHDGSGWGFLHNAANPLAVKFLIVDELSMTDCDLMADLLDACGTGTHFLGIGDPGQLPPVGHGAPLRDLIAGGVPSGELSEVRRNAGQIVHACVRIRNGESFDVADRVDLDAVPPRNLRHVEAKDEAAAADRVCDLLGRMTRFDPAWQCQVVVAKNRLRAALNARLRPQLNPDGRSAKDNPFRVGDKVICTKNSQLARVEPFGGGRVNMADETAEDARVYEAVRDDLGRAEEVYVANGEIGRVVAVAERLTVARFSEGEALVKIPMGRPREGEEEEDGGGRGCDFDLAYAVTGHRMQGSQAPCVIVVADDAGGLIASREWLYTAVSRAAKLCVLVGPMGAFLRMKDRVALHRRKTFLAERLREGTHGAV